MEALLLHRDTLRRLRLIIQLPSLGMAPHPRIL